MKALITGADGFIGSHLTELLFSEGYEIKALAQYNSFNSWGWLESVKCKDDIEIISGDIRDSNFCRNITEGIDVVFHLAALIAIPFSYTSPQSYIDTNVNGTLNICQACLDNKVTRLIHTSTSEVYGTAQYVPIDENHPLQPQSPYSASKIAADSIALSYYNSFNLPLTIVRPFNTYGPRQSARAVIPTIITQIEAGNKEIQIGDTTPTRDFNFVEDTCRGIILLSRSKSSIGEVVNIGSNTEVSIGEVIQMLKKIMSSNIGLISEEKRMRPNQSEVFRLFCDNTKISNLTSYKPKFSLEDGLKQTVQWFKDPENFKKYKAHIYNV